MKPLAPWLRIEVAAARSFALYNGGKMVYLCVAVVVPNSQSL